MGGKAVSLGRARMHRLSDSACSVKLRDAPTAFAKNLPSCSGGPKRSVLLIWAMAQKFVIDWMNKTKHILHCFHAVWSTTTGGGVVEKLPNCGMAFLVVYAKKGPWGEFSLCTASRWCTRWGPKCSFAWTTSCGGAPSWAPHFVNHAGSSQQLPYYCGGWSS
jgi:hypothetical protein